MFQEFYRGSDLLVWPIVGLLIFFLAFLLVLVYVLALGRRREELDRMASLPLEEGRPVEPARQTGPAGKREGAGEAAGEAAGSRNAGRDGARRTPGRPAGKALRQDEGSRQR